MSFPATPAQISIRIATAADAPKITAVINAAEVEESLTKGAFLLAETDGKLNGCVYVEMRGERSYLGLLSVDPTSQQGGLGSRLMNEAERYCRDRGSLAMDILIVSLRDELPAFYQKRGYSENGTTPFPADVPTKIPAHFINMSKPL